ncbi:sporulation histidine kinase inhibitor Sda [Paenibacillus sp.]|uniref:sporulation histidine kinase inhibitor Sda n=1 Tax=Paenibacillus sp. TaxID=58172 RepID=UPI002810C566|nr:sporulation histidine kinase inhibitor Sda [Paenibacillus sp.]
MIRQMTDEILLQAYRDSIKHTLDQDFIEMLERELRRRGKAPAIVGAGLDSERADEASDG